MGAEPLDGWPSPLGAAAVAGARVQRSGLTSDGEYLYWLESRPAEGGRVAINRALPGGAPHEVSPPGANVRSRVHEYGGGAFCLVAPSGSTFGGLEATGLGSTGLASTGIAYVEADDQRIYDVASGRALTQLAPAGEHWSHGDLRAMTLGGYVLAVREQIRSDAVRRSIVAVPLGEEADAVTLVEGPGFLAAPRADRGGRRLAWVGWEHPEMSWTSSTLWVADLLDTEHGPRIDAPTPVAGGPGVSVGQPLWADDGSLYFVSDAAGWWQPWRWRPSGETRRLCDEAAEFHAPDWALGQASMATIDDGRVVCRMRTAGVDRVVVIAADTGAPSVLEQPAVSIGALCGHGRGVAWSGSTPYSAGSIWCLPEIDPALGARSAPPASAQTAWQSTLDGYLAVAPLAAPLRAVDVSVAQPFSFVNREGDVVYGLFHPPSARRADLTRHPRRPPLVIQCHGGPTGSVEAGFDVVVQFLTTRGFAVAAVDYGGSAGHGRAYRDRLAGRWGVLDVDDCVDAATHLAQVELVDPHRMAIRGSSAGGLTALLALARSGRFRAAVSWYGVTDLRLLAESTHDFEAHYTDWLIGPLPEAAARYDERSPCRVVGRMSGAVLLFQGLDDRIVSPGQSAAMAQALEAKGMRCELVAFDGEGHGFRRAETIERALEAEHEFYSEVFVGGAH